MKKLSDDLKRMLTGLAHQDVGEFLPMRDKMKALGYGQENREKPLKVLTKSATTSKRIAFISDGRGLGTPLDYAIDACLRQDARIDLLFHGSMDAHSVSMLEKRVQQAGLAYQSITLGKKTVDCILDYIYNHPSLIFLVSMPDDTAAKTLIEDVIPKRGGRIHVPLVLIEEHKPDEVHKRSAA